MLMSRLQHFNLDISITLKLKDLQTTFKFQAYWGLEYIWKMKNHLYETSFTLNKYIYGGEIYFYNIISVKLMITHLYILCPISIHASVQWRNFAWNKTLNQNFSYLVIFRLPGFCTRNPTLSTLLLSFKSFSTLNSTCLV